MAAADRSRSPHGHSGNSLGLTAGDGELSWGQVPAGFAPVMQLQQPAAPFAQQPPLRPVTQPFLWQPQGQPQEMQPLRFNLSSLMAPAAGPPPAASAQAGTQAAGAAMLAAAAAAAGPAAAAAAAAAGVAAQQAESAAAQQKREERRQQEEATARLRRTVESNEGYFEPKLGYILTTEDSRYTIVSNAPLGVGVFSVVWPCADKNNKLIALKVVRWQDHFRRYAEKEVEILRRVKELADKDPEGSAQVAYLRDHFVHRCAGPAGEVEHLCMAFEKLESNLRTIGKQPIEKVLAFSKQLLLALRYLHDVVGLVHCDVKPDNLLLRWDGLAVKLCDFGTARFSTELQKLDELQPLFYRAPEVFIGATRGRKIDIWSAGCTIYELVVGRILFRSCNTNREIVEKMMKLRGPVPQAMRDQGRLAMAFFSPRGFHPEVGDPVDPDRLYKKTPMLGELAPFIDFGKVKAKLAQDLAKDQLSKLIGRTTVLSAATKKSAPTEGERKLRALADLVERCMEMDPASRISAVEACNHDVLKAVELPPHAELQEAPPLPEEAPPPLPPSEPPPPEDAGHERAQ